MNRTTKLASLGAGLAVVLALVVPMASNAAPPTPVTVTASTHLSDRPDSGGNGDWATDTMVRTLTVVETGHHNGVYDFRATVADVGTFETVSGAYTPNQGAPLAGLTLPSRRAHGTLVGYAEFSFTASRLPVAGDVPTHLHGSADSTSTWYELAFPHGTSFGGTGIGRWIWAYADHDSIRVGAVQFDTTQTWVDSSANNGGQVVDAGNIVG